MLNQVQHDRKRRKQRARKLGGIITNYTKVNNIITFPPQAGGNRREGEIDCVIANEVKQSHKSKFRLLCLPVHYTQKGRSTSRNDIDGFNETGKYVHTYLIYILIVFDK